MLSGPHGHLASIANPARIVETRSGSYDPSRNWGPAPEKATRFRSGSNGGLTRLPAGTFHEDALETLQVVAWPCLGKFGGTGGPLGPLGTPSFPKCRLRGREGSGATRLRRLMCVFVNHAG